MGEPGRVAGRTDDELMLRRVEAMKMRVSGFTYEAIAEKLGISPGQAYHDVLFQVRKRRKDMQEVVEDIRTIEAARLDRFLEKLDAQIEVGSHDAIDLALKIITRRSKLFGVDEPTVKKLEVKDTTRQRVKPTEIELRRRIKELQDRLDRPQLGPGEQIIPDPETVVEGQLVEDGKLSAAESGHVEKEPSE